MRKRQMTVNFDSIDRRSDLFSVNVPYKLHEEMHDSSDSDEELKMLDDEVKDKRRQ